MINEDRGGRSANSGSTQPVENTKYDTSNLEDILTQGEEVDIADLVKNNPFKKSEPFSTNTTDTIPERPNVPTSKKDTMSNQSTDTNRNRPNSGAPSRNTSQPIINNTADGQFSPGRHPIQNNNANKIQTYQEKESILSKLTIHDWISLILLIILVVMLISPSSFR